MPALRIHATNFQDDARRVSREHRDVVTSNVSGKVRSNNYLVCRELFDRMLLRHEQRIYKVVFGLGLSHIFVHTDFKSEDMIRSLHLEVIKLR